MEPTNPVPQPTVEQVTPPEPQGGSSKAVFVIVGIVLLLVVGLAGFYYYSYQKANSSTALEQKQVDDAINQIQGDYSSIDLGNIDSDFTGVDADIKEL